MAYKFASTFVSQVPDPQRLVPRRWYERERPVLREDQVSHDAFMAVEIKHGHTWSRKRTSAGVEKLLKWHPGWQKSHLLTHSRFWSRHSPGLWPEAGCCSLGVVFWSDGPLWQILEAWVRRPDPRRDVRSWSFCLLGQCRRSDCLWEEAWRCFKQLGGWWSSSCQFYICCF